jgi:hypothetical protein
VLRHTLPQLALLRLQVLHDLPHLLARRQLIPRLIRLAQRPWQRSLLRLQLRRRQHVQELRLLLLRLVPACRYDPQQPLEARLPEHVLQRQRLARRVPLAHLQPCNAIPLVPERPVLHPDNLVQVRRKACARLVELRNNIVRAVRLKAVLVVHLGSVRVDRLRDFRNAPVAVADRVVATIRDQ